MAISILIGFPLSDDEPILEPDLWKFLAEELGKDAMLDMCMPKPHGEALVYGRYYSVDDNPVTADRVGLRIGKINKQLAVIGNRYWRTLLGPTEPEPFKVMPINYDRSFGGKDYKKNPSGKGMDEIDVFGELRLPLPNIEDPNRLITSKNQRPEPAGFGPFDITWQQRAERIGTYDDKWLKERAPAYAEDLDWRHFNSAPSDQWLDEYFKGDEDFEIMNMHPEKFVVSGKLPGYRARCFINQKNESDENFREVDMHCETVWFFPHAETGIMLYRGTIDIAQSDASDVTHMVLGYENLADTPRTSEHYYQVMTKRLDPENGFKYLMTTLDMIPDGERCGFARMLDDAEPQLSAMTQNMEAKSDSLKEEAKDKINEKRDILEEKLTAAGLDPAPYLEKMTLEAAQANEDPHIAELMKIIDQISPGMMNDPKNIDFQQLDLSKMDDLNRKMAEIAEIKKDDAKKEIESLIEKLQEMPGTEEAIEKANSALQKMDAVPALPRPPDDNTIDQLRKQIDDAEKIRQQLASQGVPEDKLPTINVDLEKVEQQMTDGFAKIKETYRMGAHMMDEGSSPHDVPLDIILHRFNKALENGESLSGADYACIDLSDRDLSGIDMSEAYLEQVNFQGSNLKGANLTGAIMARANLANADLSGANLKDANIGGCRLEGANLSDALLDNAKLGKADLSNARMNRCRMDNIELLEAKLNSTDLSEAVMPSTIFLELDLCDAIFHKAHMPNSTFIKSDLSGADFSDAILDESTWVESKLDHSVFRNAQMTNARFLGGCSIKYSNFMHAKLDQSNFRDADLTESNFTDASLSQSDFGGAKLHRANFERSVAKRSLFNKADMEGANLASMNLMEASFMDARLTGANLNYSNCYAVEFMKATVGGTDFSGANLDRSKLENWRPTK